MAPADTYPAWWSQWAPPVLAAIGADHSGTNLATLWGWVRAEGTYDRFHNPLDTTQVEPGSWGINDNDPPVQAYPDWTTGVRATYQTLLNGRYPTIVSLLRESRPAWEWRGTPAESELTTWGTGSAWLPSGPPQPQPPPEEFDLAADTLLQVDLALRLYDVRARHAQASGQTIDPAPNAQDFRNLCNALASDPVGATANFLSQIGGTG